MADTSTIRATQRSRAKGASSPGSAASAPSPIPQPQQQQQPHHIRWSNDVPEDPDFVGANPAYRDPGDKSTAKPTSSSAVKKNKTERGGEEGEDFSLDKLLDGLTELSQTLPGKEVTNEPCSN